MIEMPATSFVLNNVTYQVFVNAYLRVANNSGIASAQTSGGLFKKAAFNLILVFVTIVSTKQEYRTSIFKLLKLLK